MTETNTSKSFTALAFDPAEYLDFLEDTGWTQAEKTEFTLALWEIVVGFVDIAFGTHPAQQSQQTKTLPRDSSDMLPFGEFSQILSGRSASAARARYAPRMDS